MSQEAEPVCEALLVQSWGRDWTLIFILSHHSCGVQRPAGRPNSQCHGCQMHCPQDVKSGARLLFVSPETDTNPKAAVGSYFGFDANVNHSLSGTFWLWLTYLLLTIQGEPCTPLKYVALCLKTTFVVRMECGILFQMHICLGIIFKTLLRILQASLDWQLAQSCHLDM